MLHTYLKTAYVSKTHKLAFTFAFTHAVKKSRLISALRAIGMATKLVVTSAMLIVIKSNNMWEVWHPKNTPNT